MQVSELVRRLKARQAGLDCLVVVKAIEDGRISAVIDVKFENHEDGDRSTTCWIIVEES